MAATVPVDLAQFYGFVIRLAQELAYIYGWMEIFSEPAELDAATESQLTVFIGVMSGVAAANQVVTKLFGEMAMRAVAKKIAAKPLAKAWYFIIAKKIAAMLGQRRIQSRPGAGRRNFRRAYPGHFQANGTQTKKAPVHAGAYVTGRVFQIRSRYSH